MKSFCAGLSNCDVISDRAATNTDRTDLLGLALDRDPSSEDDDSSAVGMLDAEKLCSRLSQCAQFVRSHIEDLRGERLVDRQFDRSRYRTVLADEGQKVPICSDNGNRAQDVPCIRCSECCVNHLLNMH